MDTQPDLFGDDLFAVSKAVPRRTTYITCKACGLLSEVPITAVARLCGLCSDDPAATYQRLLDGQQRLVATQARTCAAWEAVLAALDTEQRSRWENIITARVRGVKAERIAAIAADETDPLCTVLQAEEKTAHTLHYMADRLAAVARAIQEMDEAGLIDHYQARAALERVLAPA